MKNKMYKITGYIFSVISTFPIAIPILLTIIVLIAKGKFLYDFLMPAELILFTIIGSLGIIVLEIINKKKISSSKRLITYLSLAILNFLAANSYAYISGLAHGDTEPTGIHLFSMTIFIILWHIFAILNALECFRLTKKM